MIATAAEKILRILSIALILIHNWLVVGALITTHASTNNSTIVGSSNNVSDSIHRQLTMKKYPLSRWPTFPNIGCEKGQKDSRDRLPAVPSQQLIHDNFIVAIIVMGPATRSHILERCVASLRTLGQWRGFVLVITDASIFRYRSLLNADKMLIMEHVNDSDKNLDLIPKMQYQRFKTLLPDIVEKYPELSKIEYIIYSDVDIVFGDSVDTFCGYAEQLMWQAMYSQTGTGTLGISTQQPFFLSFTEAAEQERGRGAQVHHMGIFVLHRQRSERCMLLWRDKFDSGNYTHDQPAMAEIIDSGQCMVPSMHREAFLMFPTRESMFRGERAVFVHVTNNNRAPKVADMEYYYLHCALLLNSELAREVDPF